MDGLAIGIDGMDEWKGVRRDGKINIVIDKRDGWMDGWIGREMNGMDGWMDGF